ncbi:MAG: hypothetical protein HC863_02010 [Myxococcales bacterium]|nr:hypothetical protein [Myxococcales bacterium]
MFGDLTAQVVGKKVATILDDRVKSAPIINGAIRGGRASITMGGSDPQRQERDANDLVGVLKTGSLPAPLKEASVRLASAPRSVATPSRRLSCRSRLVSRWSSPS